MEHADFRRIAQTYGLRLILQFGSFVTGALHPRSDVDIAVLLGRSALSFEEYGALCADLQRLFPGREVDLATIDHADPLFLKQVTEHCRLLHGDPADLERLKLYAFKRYVDHAKYFDLERRYVASALTMLPSRG